MEVKLRRFYDDLNQHIDLTKGDGQPLKFREFLEGMRQPEARKRFYENVTPYVDLGDFDTFNKAIERDVKEIPADYWLNDPDKGRIGTAASMFAKSFVSMIPEMLRYSGQALMEGATTQIGMMPSAPLAIGTGMAMEKGAEKIEKATAKAFPVNYKYANELIAGKIPSIAGSITGFLVATLMAKGANLPGELAAGLTGAMTIGSEMYKEAFQETGDKTKALEAMFAGTPIGATFGITMPAMVKRLDFLFKGEITNALSLIKAGGLDQAMQLGAVRFLQNASAREIYDTERNLMDGVAEAGLTGLVSGLGLNALAVGATMLGKKLPFVHESLTKDKAKELGVRPEDISTEEKLRTQIENAIGHSTTGGKFEAEVGIRLLRALSEYTGKPMHELVSFEPVVDAKGDLLQEFVAKHGSPYVFEKFNLSHVGEGEGNRARGYGLYFTDLEDVAKFYAEMTGKDEFHIQDGLAIKTGEYAKKKGFLPSIQITLRRVMKDYYRAKVGLKEELDMSFEDFIKAKLRMEHAVLKETDAKGAAELAKLMREKSLYKDLEEIYNNREPRGYIYKARLESKDPKAFNWLDWHELLTPEQKEMIKAYLEESADSSVRDFVLRDADNLTGVELYNRLKTALSSERSASAFLHEAGFDGVRYPTGDMTPGVEPIPGKYNYVIFDDHAVQVLERNPLYQPTKGAIEFSEDGRAFIRLTKLSDITTIIHEFAHLARRYLKKEDLAILEREMEIKDGKWTVEHEEHFAKAFEHWVSEGRTTSKSLKDIFIKLKDMFIRIYGEIRKSPIAVDYTPEMEALFDKLVGGTELMTQKEKLTWAYSQIDKSYWLDQIYGSDPAGLAKENQGLETSINASGANPKVVKERMNDAGDISYERPRKIWLWSQAAKFPLWTLHKMRLKSSDPTKPSLPELLSFKMIAAQLKITHNGEDAKTWWYKFRPSRLFGVIKDSSVEETEIATRKAMELAYKMRDPNARPHQILEAKEELAKLYVKYPELQKVIDGADGRGGIITFFEHYKNKYKEALRETYRIKLSGTDYGIFSDVIDKGKSLREAIDRWIDVEDIAKKEWIDLRMKKGASREKAFESWENSPKKREQKIAKVYERLMRHYDADLIQPYLDVDKWGVDDYISNIELGNYAILDYEGKPIAYAEDIGSAKIKARKIRMELRARGQDKGPLEVKADFSRINPTEQREYMIIDQDGNELRRIRGYEEAKKELAKLRRQGKTVSIKHGVLKGEENIFKILPKYVYTMERRIALMSLEAEFARLKKEHPEAFPPDVLTILNDQMKELRGENYSWLDKVFDEISVAMGWKTGKASKMVNWTKSVIANASLGYRPTAAIINELTGFSQTYVKVGTDVFLRAREAMLKGKYKDPDGNVIDLEQKLKDIEDDAKLGLDFIVDASGNVKTRRSPFLPLGMFSMAEKPVRRFGIVANYIMLRERYGLNDQDATWQAIENMWFQQAIYNTAAIPKMLRSTPMKLVGQFKAFFINQLHFMTSLRGWEIPRYLSSMFIIGGPRAMIYFLKTVPFLAAIGVLEKWMTSVDNWVLTSKSPVAQASQGVFGTVGADVTPAVAFQFPKSEDEWLGPAISKAFHLIKDVIVPAVDYALTKAGGEKPQDLPSELGKNFWNWVEGMSPLIYYWNQVIDDIVVHWDYDSDDPTLSKFMKAFQQPNIWIRDSHGRKAYLIGGMQDRILLMSGAAPIPLSQYKTKQKLLQLAFETRIENRRKTLDRVSKKLVEGKPLSDDDINDLILYGINPKSIPNAVKWKEMSPDERLIFMQNMLDRLDAIDLIGLENH